jgi:hypothetical protein
VGSDRGADPSSPNQYAYAGGDPFTATDPSGLYWVAYEVWVDGGWVGVSYAGGGGTDWGHTPRFWDVEMVWVDDPAPGGPQWAPPCGGDLRGGGGPGGPAAPPGPKAPEGMQKTDCERYADALAESALKFRSKYPFTGSVRFGNDLYNRAYTDIALSSFGLAPTYTEFKDNLVNMDQKDGVYRHVSAAIGASLKWGGGLLGMLLPFGRTLWDELPDYYLNNNAQAIPESYGNIAGALLAPAFNRFFDGYPNKELLTEEIKDALCKK